MKVTQTITYEELETKLRETEEILSALRSHEVDAIIGDTEVAMVHLKDVEEALRADQEEQERRVAQRTAELARVNTELRETIEEQERIRRRLEDSEREYRDLVENANSIILRRDVEGRITFFNEYAQKFFGYNEQEILGKDAVGTIIPEIDSTGADRAAVFREVSRSPEEHPTTEGESISRDGRRAWIAWTHRPIRDADGRLVEILSVGNDITELKAAETARKRSERRLLKAQQIAHIGNWEVDLENHTVWWSDETYRVLGLEPGQIEPTCEAITSITHPEDREMVVRLMTDALENRRPFNIDHRIIHPSGEVRFVHSEAEIVFDTAGEPVRIAGIIECITDRKRAQVKLEDYASQLEGQAELLDLAYDMIFVHDMQGKIVFWNRGAERAFGWTREEARGQLSHRLLQTEYSEPLIRITAKIIREGRWEGELVHTTRDGRKITVASRWALRREPGGRPVAILEIDNDITDRKRAEQEMAEAKRFAESIVDTMPECLIVLDSQLRVVSANRSFYETLRTTPDQVEGRLFYTLYKGQLDLPDLRSKLEEALSGGAGFRGYELECEIPGQGRKSLMVGAQPISGRVDESRMILVMIQDISIHKEHERETQADKEQLSALTEELLLTEEHQRQRIASALHDSICQSLAFAKREIGVLERKAPKDLRRSLGEVCEQISQAIEQTRNLTLELAPSVLYTLGLEAAIEDLADQFSDSDGLLCEVRVRGETRPLSNEMRSLLYRAVRELLVNISKHAEARHVSVDIEWKESEIGITVEDDGKGFSPVETKSAGAGGFGLFSIRQRLTHVRGNLMIESEEGKGTRVTLTAPLDAG